MNGGCEMCPNCLSKETSDFAKKENLESHLQLNKCWECNCEFVSFDFQSTENLEIAVGV